MTSPGLAHLRHALEGLMPAIIATCAADGTPNVTFLSQVHYVDAAHVALSFQFFNKTRANVLENPQATVLLADPHSARRYRLHLHYCRTETAGALFESMKARLAGIASHTGMSEVFRLRGADIYRVLGIEALAGTPLRLDPPRPPLLAPLRALSTALLAAPDLEALCDGLLAGLDAHFGIDHALLLMADAPRRRLYTVGSIGYAASGVGSEVPYGAGVIGTAAAVRTPIRLTHFAAEYAYGHAVRERSVELGLDAGLETAIPLPGLAEPGSQLAVPLLDGEALLGVLCVESAADARFGYDEEDALVALAATMVLAMQRRREGAEEPAPGGAAAPIAPARLIRLRRHRRDNSLFVDDDYLIRGVAGAILWRLAELQRDSGRCDFSNAELRRDPRIGLPEIGDNLEARLILLTRRLEERDLPLRLVKTGRGRFRLALQGRLQLDEA